MTRGSINDLFKYRIQSNRLSCLHRESVKTSLPIPRSCNGLSPSVAHSRLLFLLLLLGEQCSRHFASRRKTVSTFFSREALLIASFEMDHDVDLVFFRFVFIASDEVSAKITVK